MHLNHLRLINFKNFKDLDFRPGLGLNLIIGENGTGKTNILDAIYYCCITKSYFHYSDKNCIQYNEQFFRLESFWKDLSGDHSVVIKYQENIGRNVEWDGGQYDKASQHIGKLPVVMIVPDEVYSFVQSAEERRKFLNQTLIQLDAVYLKHLIRYNHQLAQKTAALKLIKLKGISDHQLLDSYDKSMLDAANYIFEARKKLIEYISVHIHNFSNQMSSGTQKSEIKYVSDLEKKSILENWLIDRPKDILTGRIHSGIHRDKLVCKFNDQDLKNFGSQGQIKTFIIAMRLAQISYLMNKSQKKPILLLDDLFAKLDELRVEKLLSIIQDLGIVQCFITDTHLSRAVKISSEISWHRSIFTLQNHKLSLHAQIQ